MAKLTEEQKEARRVARVAKLQAEQAYHDQLMAERAEATRLFKDSLPSLFFQILRDLEELGGNYRVTYFPRFSLEFNHTVYDLESRDWHIEILQRNIAAAKSKMFEDRARERARMELIKSMSKETLDLLGVSYPRDRC